MSSGFSTTGASDGTEEQAGRGGVAAVIFSTVELLIVGAGVLSARRDQRELVSAMAIGAEAF